MLGQAKIIAFSATSNAEKAVAFYRDVLGLELVADEPRAVVFNAKGTMLRLQKAKQVQPLPYTLLGWDVTDIEATVQQLSEKGAEFVRYDFFDQDELGIWTVPDGTKIAWFKDVDGNLLSLTRFPGSGS